MTELDAATKEKMTRLFALLLFENYLQGRYEVLAKYVNGPEPQEIDDSFLKALGQVWDLTEDGHADRLFNELRALRQELQAQIPDFEQIMDRFYAALD